MLTKAQSNIRFRRTAGRLTSHSSAFLAVLVASPLLLHAQASSKPVPPRPITLALIVDAFEARQKRADSVRLRWIQTEWHRAGAFGSTTSEWTYPCEMLLRGESMRFAGKIPSVARGSVSMIDHVSSYDGIDSRYLSRGKKPWGGITTRKENTDATVHYLLPLRLYLRPLVGSFHTLDREELRLSDERKTIDGRECVAIDDGHMRVYCDCERDFIPVAIQCYIKGNLSLDGKLEYREYRRQGASSWLPQAFEVTRYSKSAGVENRFRGEKIEVEMGAPFKDSDIGLVFEPGTTVFDMKTGEEYRIQKDGTKEILRKHRLGKAKPNQGASGDASDVTGKPTTP
jgi:hypothetical protein